MTAVPLASISGDPFANRFSTYNALYGSKSYSLRSLKEAFTAVPMPSPPKLEGASLEESAQLIEQNYGVLLDRPLAQFRSHNRNSLYSPADAAERSHSQKEWNARPYNKLSLLRSQGRPRPSSPSTICVSPAHSTPEPDILPPIPKPIDTRLPHESFLPTPDLSPVLPIAGPAETFSWLDHTNRYEVSGSSLDSLTSDEAPEIIDEDFFAWLALQEQLTRTDAEDFSHPPSFPKLARNVVTPPLSIHSLEPHLSLSTLGDKSGLSLPSPPPTTKLPVVAVFNEDGFSDGPHAGTSIPNPTHYPQTLEQNLGGPVPKAEEVIAELQNLSYVFQQNFEASEATTQSGTMTPSRYPGVMGCKERDDEVKELNEDDMASAEADRLSLLMLEMSIEEERQAETLREIAGKLDNLTHLRRSVAAALANM
ncbi:uncharacterized protein EI90DRAFT_3129944 [Cantharellus anzutake]|uniref:uncharacterized protein n=1 Tax=Cantharellus anzutake TaxID=1750568 RepID=UPI001906C2D0|nr:uncharacterized protein EI90DRAFT_3129944 [Cantharellus anzutake]KAF8324479.1 hypothetical protein EI90DRAFT_3129944 [Cantharellus anzutake]